MSISSIFQFVVLSLFMSQVATAAEFGELIIGGTGCFGSVKMVNITGQDGRYALPIRARVNKKSETSFDRKSCQLRLPIKVSSNEKMQLWDMSQVVRIVSPSGVTAQSRLSLGFVGRNAKSLVLEMQASPENPSQVENLKENGLISESICGQDTILAGNLSLLAQGQGTQAFMSTGTALVTIKAVPCTVD